MKRCFKCGKEKYLDDFYIHLRMKDGHLNKCKECTKIDIKINTQKNSDYYKEYDRQRAMLPHRVEARKRYEKLNPDKIRKYKDNYKLNNPDKKLAVQYLNNSLRSKKIIKLPCEICGDLNVHAHHSDYSKPLEVIWLCPKHHKEAHKM